VRVVVTAEEDGIKKLGFVFPEGPVLPRPERDIVPMGFGDAGAEVLSHTVTPAVIRKKSHDAQVIAKDTHATF
jgi:hypothetical protein